MVDSGWWWFDGGTTIELDTWYHGAFVYDGLTFKLQAFDCSDGSANQVIKIFSLGITYGQQTFVWNDKFSFNGYDATGFNGGISTTAEQNALADQGGGNAQELRMNKLHNNDKWHVTCTYIHQNNA